MKRRTQFINIFLVVVLLLSLSVTAFAENWYYASNVSLVRQAKTQWCWAASAEMAAKNVYPNTDRTQWHGVQQVKGSTNVNQPGTSNEACVAAETICYGRADFRSNYFPWTMASIRNEIMNNNKALIVLGGYYNNGQRTSGHFVTIDAVYQTSNYIRYKDPWDATQHWVSYTQFSNGSYNGRVYEETVYNR